MEITFQTVMSQIMLGLNNGVFYAILSLGLAVIFGLLNIVNFAHGALYMLGAYVALLGYTQLGPLHRDAGLSSQLLGSLDCGSAGRRYFWNRD